MTRLRLLGIGVPAEQKRTGSNFLPLADDAPFLFDVTRLIWRRWKGRWPTGIDRVALAYLEHFGPRSQAVIQHERFRRILDTKSSRELFALLEAPGTSFKPKLIGGFLKNLGRFRAEGRGRFYLNVGHTGLNSPGFRTWTEGSNVRPIYFVHDLIPISHPQFARPDEDVRHRERMRTALMTSAGIIGNSRATLDELASFGKQEGLRIPDSVVAWLGIDPLALATGHDLPARPTFVTLGTIEGRKNHLLLLNAWSRLVSRLGENAPRLLMIGQRGWEAEEVFDRLDHDETLRGHVMELPSCSDFELAQHLRSARALLFPSFAEGYGLPLLEALSTGVPAIASDLPVFRELCGDIPTYLDPEDQAGWEAAIVDYAGAESASRAAQIKRLEGFAAPTWTQHFSTVDSWLRRLG